MVKDALRRLCDKSKKQRVQVSNGTDQFLISRTTGMHHIYIIFFSSYIPGHDHILEGEGGSHVSQIMFFCGHKKHCCVINSERAFK